jgi:CheY-like chemotaxis protein/glycine cleavage system H lipoate-binding protein
MDNLINILIVDDEQIVIDSIKKHLKNERNYQIFSAVEVESALRLLTENQIDIVLTDLMMPEIDGLELLKILQDKNENIIPIMITGYATINTALQAQQLGAFDYLAKPFTKDELKKLVSRAASLVQATRENAKDNLNLNKKLEISNLKVGLKGIGEHSWFMREDDGRVIMGVERAFLYRVGKIQNLYLPSVGDELRQGSVFFQIFSAELRNESLLSPLSGQVSEINEHILKSSDIVLEDPYGKGWLIKLIPTNFEEEIKILGL